MLIPLVEADFPVAAALLAEGFPTRSRAFWDEGLQLLKRHAGNEACGVPFGQLLMAKGEPVGIALTPAGPRQRPDGTPYALVNFSSWYVRPENRWGAPMMLRQMFTDPRATYLDLTPMPQVEKMLLASGFRAVNEGTRIAVVPLCAARPGSHAKVRELTEKDRVPGVAPPLETLLNHRELGCVPLLMEHEGGQTLFVYRPRPLRGIPAARLKYTGSHAVLQRHLPALTRYLLGRGLLFLTWDARGPWVAAPGIFQRRWGTWYAKGEVADDCSDFIGTELCLLGV